MKPILIYMTTPAGEGEKIAAALLEKNLVACANIMAPHQSIYKWKGKVERGTESVVIFKTRESLFEQVRVEICALHSYECPCIVALPIVAGHEPFLQWIEEQTA